MGLVIEVPSNLINVVNFIIFEVLLISFIFFLSTDISGRLNYFSLASGEQKQLVVLSPPIVGGGVCSTSLANAICVLLIRAFGVLLVFGTALTIDGETKAYIATHKANVLVPAPLGNTTRGEFRDAISNRTSCQITSDGYIYHGLLYANRKCENNTKVLQDQIRFRTTTEFVSTSLRDCKTKRKTKLTSGFFEDYRCTNGVISCNFFSNNKSHPNWCRGTLETETGQYICSTFKSRNNQNWTGECHRSFNLGLVKDYWLDSWKVSGAHMIDALGAFSILGQEEKSVQYVEKRRVTNVSTIWIIILILKVAVVIALSCLSLFLKHKGAMCVINDENGLAHVLRRSISDVFGLADDDCKLYLYHKKVGTKIRFWASKNPHGISRNRIAHEEESKFH